MAKPQKPYVVVRRADSKTYQLTINESSGLPWRICKLWQRQSFSSLPLALAQHRKPKTKAAAEVAAVALISYLSNPDNDREIKKTKTKDITVGEWLLKFTNIETSPRTARNAARNRPYSAGTLRNYKSYYESHIRSDPFVELRMAELEEQDVLEFSSRMSLRKKILANGRFGSAIGGTRTFVGIIAFVRMACKEYQRTHQKWFDPFSALDKPTFSKTPRDALSEDELVRLFSPGVLNTSMEYAICAAMFLAGLRRSELFALTPDCLDWKTPKIRVKKAWQMFDYKTRVIGPTKGKKERDAPFDSILQNAIRQLWIENGQHEYVFAFKDGSIPGARWARNRFKSWLKAAGIDTTGRKIVPHSARHTLASVLEERGISLRYIQETLGHSDLKTTRGYLHTTDATIRKIGSAITGMMPQATNNVNLHG